MIVEFNLLFIALYVYIRSAYWISFFKKKLFFFFLNYCLKTYSITILHHSILLDIGTQFKVDDKQRNPSIETTLYFSIN